MPDASRHPPIGPVGRVVIRNVEGLRQTAGLSLRALSDRLDDIRRPILAAVLHRLVQAKRRVDADDLVALAIALGVTPSSLLLPRDVPPDAEVELTPKVRVPAWAAWAWADGRMPLPAATGTAGERFARETAFAMLARPAFSGGVRLKVVSEVYELADQIEALEAAEDPELQDMLRDRVNRTVRRLIPDLEDLFDRRPGFAAFAPLTREQLREAVRSLPEPAIRDYEPPAEQR